MVVASGSGQLAQGVGCTPQFAVLLALPGGLFISLHVRRPQSKTVIHSVRFSEINLVSENRAITVKAMIVLLVITPHTS